MGDDSHLSGFLPTQHSFPLLPGGLPVAACGASAAEQGGKLVKWVGLNNREWIVNEGRTVELLNFSLEAL